MPSCSLPRADFDALVELLEAEGGQVTEFQPDGDGAWKVIYKAGKRRIAWGEVETR